MGRGDRKAGFDRTRPAVVSSLGVTKYLSVDAIQAMLRDVARLAPGSLFVCGFALPARLIEPDEREMRAETEARAAARATRGSASSRSMRSAGSLEKRALRR